ncbi:N,N-dimethylformamidase large subunit [Marivita cryptomonadis]|uniref:N,N-dimethylformamidase beta subunit family domain-containing protein n=1 Tax=Marivita cryptomonadis TaxID=505252 RepID=UPI000A1DAFAB|nr:N,N-dimethylformamidase beta subunit family domain-containing protein [Marivita cryptomonadis]OSQ58655.1 N,N-dimethylformamidase large subunit [Marivita cryptomonadis]
MSELPRDLPIAGYVEQLSGRPGEALEFKVSSISNKPFTARLFRSICADPNPDGPGIVEEDASEYFATQEFASTHRPFFPGSYGVAAGDVSENAEAAIVFSATIYPTQRSERAQTVLGCGEFDLCLDPQGAACFQAGATKVSTNAPLKLRQWHRVEGRLENGVLSITQNVLGRYAGAPVNAETTCSGIALQGTATVGARVSETQACQHFNGKIEAPSIIANDVTLCAWDFAQAMKKTIVPSQAGPELTLVNFPARAVTGANWDATEMNWSHRPDHYAAIHFHQDDIYDFGWDTDFTFTIPDDMPSGIYVMRLECDGQREAIPFFVCPLLGKRRADLCVLVSTFTYAIYGNHARPDYDPSWQDRISDWNAYPHNPAEYPQYGLSTYNYHSDGSGICHGSHRRPLLNLRPGYLTFGNTPCSGLRHFPADSHLISWLHAKGINYDIVTDNDLHIHGHAAISDYKVLTTGTHPEYHTEESLNALRDYRDNGGHLAYLGGNGFYWRIAIHSENDGMLEIRRAEDGIRAWAAEPGEYYNAFDGNYGGLWRRNGRVPQDLVGIGFAAQGEFFGDPYRRVTTDPEFDWVFAGVQGDIIGDFGYSGNGAAGFELDHMDGRIGTPDNAVLLARSVTREHGFMLVPEEQLTHLTNLTGVTEAEAKRADMIYCTYPGGGSVFATGSITFCGSLPWNDYDNNVSQILQNVFEKALS